MKVSLTLTILICLIQVAKAEYKYVIYTDQQDQSIANEFVQEIKRTHPFNKFELDFDIVQVSSSFLDCKQGEDIKRLINCDQRAVARRQSREGYDQALIISDNTYGGAGGGIPIAGTRQKDSDGNLHRTLPTVMVHEYLHTLGFGDEYIYDAFEANKYCKNSTFKNYVNIALIKPRSRGYSNDSEARSRHSREIPWYSTINSSTPISQGSLGTPSSFSQEIGLYPLGTCQYASNGERTWRPSKEDNVMGTYGAPIGSLAPLVEDALSSLGVERREVPLEVRTETPTRGTSSEAQGHVHSHDHSDSPEESERIILPDFDSPPDSTSSISLGNSERSEDQNNPEISSNDSPETRQSSTASNPDEGEQSNVDLSSSGRAIATSNSASRCQMQINKFFDDPANRKLKEEYMKIQGKITLHRIAWTYLKQMKSSTDSIEGFIQDLIVKRDPTLHKEFINSGAKSRNEKLSFAISEMRRVSQELVAEPKDQTYALQYSDVKMMNLLANAEELNGRGMKNGVMDFTSIINNSLKNKFGKKERNINIFKKIIDSLVAKKNEFESKLLTYLESVDCAEVANTTTCEVESLTNENLSNILQNSEDLIDYVYRDDFGKKQELKNIYQWQNYWLHVAK